MERPKARPKTHSSPKPFRPRPTGAPREAAPTGPAEAWLFQSPPGLALLLKKELVRVGAVDRKQNLLIKRQRNHDLVFANRIKPGARLNELRIAETVMQCPVFGRYKVSQNQLTSLASVLRPEGPRRLVLQVAGKVFDRRDFGRWLEKEIETRDYKFDEEVEDEVWMICIDESYYFGIPRFKRRALTERSEERTGALPPAIAAAMAFAAQPQPTDVILDPVCGSGTLLAEAHAYAPQARRFGMDIDGEAVRVARANAQLADGDAILQGDSRKLASAKELKDANVTLVLANLPFGKQYGNRATNADLYRDVLRSSLELARTPQAREAWRAVVLTSDFESLNAATTGFTRQDLFKVKIRGEIATAVLLRPAARGV